MGVGKIRNKPCSCNSGKKFKHCCWSRASSDVVTPLQEKEEKNKVRYYNKKYKEITERLGD